MSKTISHSFAALTREILFLPLEHKSISLRNRLISYIYFKASLSMEKGVQVACKVGKIIKKNRISQTELSYFGLKDAESQCGGEKSSYGRSEQAGPGIDRERNSLRTLG